MEPLSYPVWLMYLLLDAVAQERAHAVVALLYRTAVLPVAWKDRAEPTVEALAGWIQAASDHQAFHA